MAHRAGLVAALLLAGVPAGTVRAEAAGDGALRAPPAGSPGSAVTPPPPPSPNGLSWFVLPVLFWMPETRVGLATAAGLHFRLDGAPRGSSVFAVGAYTLERQYSADLASEVTLRGGTVLTGRVRAVYFPDLFYGVGPRTPTSAREEYTRRWAQGLFSAEFTESTNRFRIGPRLDLRAEDVTGLEPGGQLASGRIEGARGFTAIGLGGSAAWDTRDQPLFPSRGALLELWYLHYPEELGRHLRFSVLRVEARAFRRAFGPTILGAAAYVEQAFGSVPFTLLPKLGSTGYLRGWREGRFRDDLAAAAQVELRIPLPDRFAAVVFASAGEVAHDLGALRLGTLRAAGGAGLRFRLTPEGTNIRLDVAEGGAGPEVYLVLLEAF